MKGATGCEMGVAGRTVEGRNGGTLTPHPPGSNGGVHRGPDLFPRANILRAIGAQALAEMQVEGKGKSRRQVQMAMVGHAVKALQRVAKNGAQGKQVGPFLRMFFGLHEMFQPGKHEKPNGAGPRPAKFVYADPAEPPADPPPPPPAPGTLLDANGQQYVAG